MRYRVGLQFRREGLHKPCSAYTFYILRPLKNGSGNNSRPFQDHFCLKKGNSGPTGEIFAYLTHLDIISPGVRYRLKAMLSSMFCVCVLARPRYRQRPPSNHRRMLPKVRSMTLRIGLMERLKRCCAWLKGRLRYALCMIQSRK